MHRLSPFVRFGFLGFFVVASAEFLLAEKPQNSEPTVAAVPPAKWEKDISALEKLDAEEIADEKSILFLGSSSIRRWDSIAQDMQPWRVVRRGYGGAKFSDLAVYAPRLLAAHRPQAVVVYVGNDITGKPETDRTPEEVLRLFESVAADVHRRKADAHVFVVGITPAPKRFEAWPKIQQANALLREGCSRDPRLHFIETAATYLDKNGQPRPELYVEDRLHQNSDGYKLWSGLIRNELEKVLGSPTKSSPPNDRR